MAERLRVALLFGGRSAEHDVSVISAGNVFRALDPARYDTVPIGITRSGVWRLSSLEDGAFPAAVPESGPRVALVPGGARRARDPFGDGCGGARLVALGRRRVPGSARPLRRGWNGPGRSRNCGRALCRFWRPRLGGCDGQGCRQASDARRRPADRALPLLRASGDAPAFRGGRRRARPSGVRQARAPRLVGRHQQGGDGAGVRSGDRRGVPARPQDPRRGIRSAAARSSAACSKARTARSPPRCLARSCPATATASTPTRPNISTRRAPRSRFRLTSPRRQRQGPQAVDRGFPRAWLRGLGAHRLFSARGWQVS